MADNNPLFDQFEEKAGSHFGGVAFSQITQAVLRKGFQAGFNSIAATQLKNMRRGHSKHKKSFALFLVSAMAWAGKHPEGLIVLKEIVESMADQGKLPGWAAPIAESTLGSLQGANEAFEKAGIKPEEGLDTALAALFGETPTNNGDDMPDGTPDGLDPVVHEELGKELADALLAAATEGGPNGPATGDNDGDDGNGNCEGDENPLDPGEMKKKLEALTILFGLFMMDGPWDVLELPSFLRVWTRCKTALRRHPKLIHALPTLTDIDPTSFNELREELLNLRTKLLSGELAPIDIRDDEAKGLDEAALKALNEGRKTELDRLKELRQEMRKLWGEFDGFFVQCELLGEESGLVSEARGLLQRIEDRVNDMITDQVRANVLTMARNSWRRLRRWTKDSLPRHLDTGMEVVITTAYGMAFLGFAWLTYALVGTLGFFAGAYGMPLALAWFLLWGAWWYFSDQKIGSYIMTLKQKVPNKQLRKSMSKDQKAREKKKQVYWKKLRKANKTLNMVFGAGVPVALWTTLAVGSCLQGRSAMLGLTNGWFWIGFLGMILALGWWLWTEVLVVFALRLAVTAGQGLVTTGGGLIQQGADYLMQQLAEQIEGMKPPELIAKQLKLREPTAKERPMLALGAILTGRGVILGSTLAVLDAWTFAVAYVMTNIFDLDIYLMLGLEGVGMLIYIPLWVLSVFMRVVYAFAFLDDMGGGNFKYKSGKIRRYANILEGVLVVATIFLLALAPAGGYITWAFGNQALSSECKTYSDVVAYADKHELDMDHPDVMKCEAAAEHYTNEASALLDVSQKKRKDREQRNAK